VLTIVDNDESGQRECRCAERVRAVTLLVRESVRLEAALPICVYDRRGAARALAAGHAPPTSPSGCRALPVLMPSTPLAYLQVISRRFACFRVPNLSIYAAQVDLCDEFDSRQLHRVSAGQGNDALTSFLFVNVSSKAKSSDSLSFVNTPRPAVDRRRPLCRTQGSMGGKCASQQN
jgi:hypothetical protein